VQTKCITLKLTDAQKEAVRQVTGRTVDTVTVDVDDLDDRGASTDSETAREADAIVWECLNPYR
jgi:hypothetical protein